MRCVGLISMVFGSFRFELLSSCSCFVLVFDMCGDITIIIYYIILLYTYLYSSLSSFPLPNHPLLPSLPLPFLSSSSLLILIHLPFFLIYLLPHNDSFPILPSFYLLPFLSFSFKVYVSVLTYTYLYSIPNLRQFDPACFIGVDG